MGNSDMDSVFKILYCIDRVQQPLLQTYLESYRLHNLDTKATGEVSCTQGIQWLWIVFGECLLSVAQISGYFCGALSMLLWTVGYLMACSQIQPATRLWNLLILTFIVNVVSFAGAIMSFQIIFVIWYDMFTTLILVLVLTITLLTMSQLLRPCHKYQPLSKGQGQVTPSLTQWNNLGVVSSRVCCTLLCLVTMSLFFIIFIALTSLHVLSEPLPNRPAAMDYINHVILGTVGYLLGCLACFGRWWIDILFVSIYDKEMRDNRIWTGSGVVLIISNVMYLLGILLQSGNFQVVIVTLPWLAGRIVQGCCPFVKHVLSLLWLICPLRKHDTEAGAKTKNKPGKDSETANLLISSGSDSSDIHVIFDRACEVTENRQVQGHADNRETTTAIQRSTTLQITSLDVTTSSDSETSNATSEQELIWNDHDIIPSSNGFTELSLLRHQRLSLASQIETLSQSSSETSDQRVRSWISQSTPEEETPPCLTLTLNLDTVNKSTNYSTDDNFFENRKCNFAGAFPLSLRKNSV